MLQIRKSTFILIAAVLGISLLAAGIGIFWAMNRDSIPSLADTTDEAEEEFYLAFFWGACSEEASFNILEIEGDGSGAATTIDASGTKGRERLLQLSPEQMVDLKSNLRQNNVMSLPREIVSDDSIIPLQPGCSRLVLQMGDDSHQIDEADGINREYFRIKQYLADLAP